MFCSNFYGEDDDIEMKSQNMPKRQAGLPSGVYLYRIQAGDPSTGSGQNYVQTKKMILLK